MSKLSSVESVFMQRDPCRSLYANTVSVERWNLGLVEAPCPIEFGYVELPAFSGADPSTSFRPALLIERASI